MMQLMALAKSIHKMLFRWNEAQARFASSLRIMTRLGHWRLCCLCLPSYSILPPTYLFLLHWYIVAQWLTGDTQGPDTRTRSPQTRHTELKNYLASSAQCNSVAIGHHHCPLLEGSVAWEVFSIPAAMPQHRYKTTKSSGCQPLVRPFTSSLD